MEILKNLFYPLIKQNGPYYNTTGVQKNLRSDIQILRALAVALVFLFHLDIPFFKGGFIGVDIFFVISGYLVVGSIFKTLLENKFSYPIFLANRIKRLLPASFVCLLFVFCLFLILPDIQHWAGNQGWYDIVWSAAHGANIKFFINQNQYFRSDNTVSFLLHYWTLALEEQFYLIAPIILSIFYYSQKYILSLFHRDTLDGIPDGHLKVALFIFTLIFTVTSFILCLLPQLNIPHKFFMVHTRAWEFLSGSVVSLYSDKIKEFWEKIQGTYTPLDGIPSSSTPEDEESAVELYPPESSSVGFPKNFAYWFRFVLIGILIIFGVFTPSENFPSAISLPIVIITCIALSIDDPIDNLFLESIGNWSYSIYLYHFPIIQLFKRYALNGDLKILLIVTITIILAVASFYFIEQKALNLNIFPLGWFIILIILSTGLAIGAAFLFSYPTFMLTTDIHHVPSFYRSTASVRGSVDFNITSAELDLLKYNVDIAAYTGVLQNTMSSLYPRTSVGLKLYSAAGTASDPTKCILAYGDSNIAHWFPALKKLANITNYTSIFFTGSTPNLVYDPQEIEVIISYTLLDPDFQKCKSVISIFARVSIGIWFYNQDQLNAVRAGINRLVTFFAKKGGVVVIQSIPRPPGEYNPNVCIHNEMVKGTVNITEKCSMIRSSSVYDYNKLLKDSNVSTDILLDMNKYLCSNKLCTPNYHEIPIYMDQTHISEAIAEFLSATFVDEVLNILSNTSNIKFM